MKILGVPSSLSALVVCAFMLALALSGSYATAEKIGLTVGSIQVFRDFDDQLLLRFRTGFIRHPKIHPKSANFMKCRENS